jgi:hypothetical protein
MPERAARQNQLVNATLGVCARDLERREFDTVRDCTTAIPIASIAPLKPARSCVLPAIKDSRQ